MIQPRAAARRFATSVVGAAIASGHDPQDVTTRLHGGLANLVGAAGVDVLLARSLVLALRTHPFLAAVVSGPGGTFAGLRGAADLASVEQGAATIVAYFVELLAALIGEDLALRLVRDACPEPSDAGSAPAKARKE